MDELKKSPDPNQMSVVLAAYLFVTHFIAGGVAVVVIDWLAWLSPMGQLLLGLGVTGLIGVLLTLNLQRSIRMVDWALVYLTGMVPLTDLSPRGHGALTGLITRLNILAQRERPFTQMRQHQLQQASQAAAQEERNRLARDLHDSIKQQLFSIQISAAAVQVRWQQDAAGAKQALADVRHSAKAALAEMNALLQQLSPAPLEKVGLVQSLRQQCEALGYRTGAEVEILIGDLPHNVQFPVGAQEAIFRIVQEAFSNVARHARATRVIFRLQQNQAQDRLLLTIADNGQGFVLNDGHGGMGLNNVRQRVQALGGELMIDSQPGQGTTLQISMQLVEQLNIKEQIMNKPDHFFNRVTVIGLGGGVALIAALFYPVYILLPGQFLTDWPAGSPLIGFVSEILAVLLTMGIGYMAVRQADMSNRRGSLLVAASAGLIAGAILFFGLLGAGAGLIGNQTILQHGLTQTATDSEVLWLVAESVTATVWWGFGGFMVTMLVSMGLAVLGGSLAPLSRGKEDRNWMRLHEGGYLIAFMAVMSGLLSLVVTVVIYLLLGDQVIETAQKIRADQFTLSLPAVGVAIWPPLTAMVVYLVGLAGLTLSLQPVRKASKGTSLLMALFVTYMGAGLTVLLPVILFSLVPNDAEITAVLTILIGGGVLNLLLGLLLLRTAFALEQKQFMATGVADRVEKARTGLMLAFVAAYLLTLFGYLTVAVGVLIVVMAVYTVLLHRQIPSTQAQNHPWADWLPRTLEITAPVILALTIPSLVIVSPSLGMVLITIFAIPSLDGRTLPSEGALAGQIQLLFQAHGFSLLITMAMMAMLMGLAILVSKIAVSRQRR